MGISVSGVTPAATAVVQSPAVQSAKPGGKSEPQLDFGPAVSFTPTSFDQALTVQMYNSSGAAVALTQWLRNGTLPPPESVSAVEG